MLRSASQSEVKHDDLVAACESDKVAASRAMKQNKQLKEENVELQSALVELVSLRNRKLRNKNSFSFLIFPLAFDWKMWKVSRGEIGPDANELWRNISQFVAKVLA